MRIDADGYLVGARRVDSPNCDGFPAGCEPSMVVIHAISLPPGEFGGPWIEALFCSRLDPGAHPYFESIATLRVSSHFLIRRDGALLQFVSLKRRAWHAGVSSWQGRECCNDFSIGIELEGCDDLPFESSQYRSLNALLEALRGHFDLTDVVGHSDVAPGRKTDPGPCFDWGQVKGCG